MASTSKIRVAIVGLGFGAEFIPIYQNHPGAEMYAICRRNAKGLNEVGDRYGIKTRYTDYAALLRDPNVDAVHINSPIPDHAPQAIAALRAGKHVASTVPMATDIEGCRQIVELQRQTGKVIQRFGGAKLIRQRNGQHELIGGSNADRTAAFEWVSLFAHEIVFTHFHREADGCRRAGLGWPGLQLAR